MAKLQFLEFTVRLTDAAEVARLQAIAQEGVRNVDVGKFVKSPNQAATDYSAPILEPTVTFTAPCITSPWFESDFPRDVRTFERRSSGFFGFIGSLFGIGLTRYWWLGNVELAPTLGTEGAGGDEIPAALATRRWVNGFETGAQQWPIVARGASRHTQGMGALFDDTVTFLTESHANPFPDRGWERLYIRIRKYPVGAGARLWRCLGFPSEGAGASLTIMPSGQLALESRDAGGTGSLIATTAAPIALHKWTRLDILFRYNQTAPPDNAAFFQLYVNGALTLDQPEGFPGLKASTTTQGSQLAGGSSQNGAVYHLDDWIAAALPNTSSAGHYNGPDWTHGSRVGLVAADHFAPGHDAAWIGDWRSTRLRPRGQTDNAKLTTTSESVLAAVITDADREVDGVLNQLGIAAMRVSLFGAPGDADSTLGYTLPGQATVEEPSGLAAGVGGWARVHYLPENLPTPVTPLAGLELTFRNGSGTAPASIEDLVAEVEIIGTFGPEDVAPGTTPAEGLLPRGDFVRLHNAPYPRTPWATQVVAPTSPVVLHTGRYTGTGVDNDLLFRCPVHLLVLRAIGTTRPPILWASAMNAAHKGGVLAYTADGPVEVLIDPLFVAGTTDGTITGNQMPQTPSTLAEAVTLANTLAYGFAKHAVGDSVWARYLDDPDYYFRRMLGWQAGGGDVALYGLYAVPPSEWAAHGDIASSTQQQQTRVRLVGSGDGFNQNGQAYEFFAFCDPGMRFLECGALYLSTGATAIVSRMANEAFTADAVILQRETTGSAASTAGGFMKGLGHAGATLSPWNAAVVSNGLTVANGTLTSGADLHAASLVQIAYAAFRRDDGSGDVGVPRVLQLASYTGDGSASRTIGLAPLSARRPMFAIVTPHNGPSVLRDPGHLNAESTQIIDGAAVVGGITGGGLDSVSVGSVLNANGVVYDVFVIPGSTNACQNGWSCEGEQIPVEPDSPIDPGWDPGPVDPEPTDPTEPGGGTPGPGGPGTTPGTGPDYTPACIGPSTILCNQALSRIGVSKRIVQLATEPSQEADTARTHYSETVNAVLRDWPWPWATKYAVLSRIAVPATVPPTPWAAVNQDWAFAYRTPADALFVRRVVNPARRRDPDPDPIPFRVGGDVTGGLIYTDDGTVDQTLPAAPVLPAPPVMIEYTARPVCPALVVDPLFRSALVWRLAHEFAPTLARDQKLTTYCFQMYLIALDRAKTVAANEATHTHDGQASWIVARGDD